MKSKKVKTKARVLAIAVLLGMIGAVNVQMVAAAAPGDANDDGVVDDFELLNYIDQWALGEVRDSDLLTAISIWSGEWCLEQIGNADVVFTVPKNRGVAKLYFTDATAWGISWNDCWYADQIIDIAEEKGYTVEKSQSNMAYEISAHIALYWSGETDHSNPIDIELYTGNWIAPGWWPDLPWEVVEVPCI